jgi:hypothetical protein
MSSVMNPGTNYFGSNPLGQKVRSLEVLVETLRKKVESLEKNGVGSGTVVSGPPGPAGPAGPPGPAGPAGPAGPMAYIAMPPSMMAAHSHAPSEVTSS